MKSIVRSLVFASCLCGPNPLLPVAPGQSREDASEMKTGYAGHYACRGFSGTSKALCAAVSDGEFGEVRRLVEAGADLEAGSSVPLTRGMTILQLAVWHKWDMEAVKLLIDLGADVDAKDQRGNSALIYAIKARPAIRLPQAELLLEAGAGVKAKGEKGMTALMHAAMHDNIPALKILLEAGADVRARDKTGWTALMHATRIKYGYTAVVASLIEAGSDVNAAHRHGGTALSSAAYNGHAAVVRLLIEARANVNPKDKAGWTPLICSAVNGHAEVVALLLGAGADLNARDHLGRTALSVASDHGHAKVVSLLTAAGAR